MQVAWGEYDESDRDALGGLARACLAADGGLPTFAEDDLLGARMLGGRSLAGRDGSGRLVAAASLLEAGAGVTTTGMVLPARRGAGLGRHLLGWAVQHAVGRPMTVATESLSPGAEALYARFGLVETFRELVMRHPLHDIPDVPAPVGVRLVPVDAADPADLFAAYVSSFADRPGFPDPTREEWLADLADDPDWRRDVSVVALADAGPVGFVNVLGGWIDQVGVVPAWRGHQLGAHLVSRSLAALAAARVDAAWLTVAVGNTAAGLYTGLGFEAAGSRARFASAASSPG
jgi:GNAT superfamily N-acetyltransferase